jgi:nitrite reductase (NADH) large subunit
MRVRAWKCEACGFVHVGAEPPDVCPVCGVDASFFSAFEFEDEVAASAPPPAAADGAALRLVVVGGGVAGVTAAEEARRRAPDAHVTLVTDEPGLPFYRLNLTRVLAGEVAAEALPLHPARWYEEQRVALRAGRVNAVDRAAQVVRLEGGEALPYDRLVLATGALPFRPPIPGADKDGVLVLRTLADAEAILARAQPGARAVCVGGGLLGLEAAGALARRGLVVTVLEAAPWLMPRQLGARAGAVLAAHLAAVGVHARCGVRIAAIGGEARADGVRLASGEVLPADLVLLGAGVRPDLALARACGLTVQDGVVVDDTLATSDPLIFAAGDVAQAGGRPPGIWPVAWAQGVVAGANAAGAGVRYRAQPPANTLKVLTLDVFSAGEVGTSGAAVEPVETLETLEIERDGHFLALVFRADRLVGAHVLGRRELAPRLQQAVEAGAARAELADLLDVTPAPDPRGTAKEEHPMESLKGTRTEKNLLAAFAGESQARNRYNYAAGVARKAGLLQIAAFFEETADNEKEHAKRFFNFLEGGMVEIVATYPAGKTGDTAENLLAAAEGEHEEWAELYPTFAAIAKEEGFPQVAATFLMIARAEKAHETRFRKLLANVEQGKVFEREEPTQWKCRNCGYVHEGQGAPDKCPACQHAKDHFELFTENY